MRLNWLVLFFVCVSWSHNLFANDAFVERPDVRKFIAQMVHRHHFNRPDLVKLFSTVKVKPSVIRSIKAPLEQKPWYTYQMLFVTEWRIRQGVKFWHQYHDALERAEKKYGVPASIIVATIGIETKYGRNTGNYRVIDAISNLAFSDSPRAPFFRNELEQFLLLTREQHLDPRKVMGSYAGAIGQPQFMPSSYRNYAISFDNNAQIDLSHNEVDVIGSIANYYQKHGWQANQPVAMKTLRGSYPLTKMIELQGYFGKEYWLGYHNFDVIKRYNSSNMYAMAVYQLSYYISMLRGKTDNV